MEEALGEYITPQGVEVYEQAADAAGGVRDEALRAFTRYIGPVSEKAAYLTLLQTSTGPIPGPAASTTGRGRRMTLSVWATPC